jgi:hypothetical protein
MSFNVEVQAHDFGKFYSNLNLMIEGSKRGMKKVVKTQFKGVVRNMLSVTPPNGGTSPSLQRNDDGEKTGRVDFDSGLKAGRAAMLKDIKNAFWQMDPKSPIMQKRWESDVTLRMLNEPKEETLKWYLSVRNKRKRVNSPIRRPASVNNVSYVLEYLHSRQGTTLAGWLNVARHFSLSLPRWVSRWGGSKSNFKVQDGDDVYYIYAENVATSRQFDHLSRLAEISMNMQANNMQRTIDDLVKKEARNLGFLTR